MMDHAGMGSLVGEHISGLTWKERIIKNHLTLQETLAHDSTSWINVQPATRKGAPFVTFRVSVNFVE